MKKLYYHTRNVFLIFLCISINYTVFAQDIQTISVLDKYLRTERYDKIIDYYDRKGEDYMDPKGLRSYYLGVAHFNSAQTRNLSFDLLNDFIQNKTRSEIDKSESFDVFLMLGELLHENYELEQAIDMYNEFLTSLEQCKSISGSGKKELRQYADLKIDQCSNAFAIIQNPRNVHIENLGQEVNSEFPDYAAVVSQNENLLFFTSRRPDSRGNRKQHNEGFFEDIYSTNLQYGSLFDEKSFSSHNSSNDLSIVTEFKYNEAKNLGNIINSVSHDASVQLSPDEQRLYFYRDSDLWFVNMESDSIFGSVERMDVNFNSQAHEPSLFISSDNQVIILVSERRGGFGGLDLYISHKQEDGTWGEPKNMGSNVNTPFDEDAPYLDPDGKTLYFSSKGHSSMGGFDVFRSTLTDGTFTAPMNLGYPVNTVLDDTHFTMTSKYNRGYYASNRPEGFGDMDIYRISFADERDPVADIKGKILKGKEKIPVVSNIIMHDLSGDLTLQTQSEEENGKYSFVLGTGRTYRMELTTEGFVPYVRDFKIPEVKDYFRMHQEIHHVHLVNSNGDIIGQQVSYLDFNSSLIEVSDSSVVDDSSQNQENWKVDTRFYMTEDSLNRLLLVDTNLNFEFEKFDSVKYLRDDSNSKFEPDSYTNSELENPFYVEIKNEAENLLNGKPFEKDKLSFSVQVGSFSRVNPKMESFNELTNVRITPQKNGLVTVQCGDLRTYDEAHLLKEEIQNKGFEGVFVTAFYEDQSLSTAAALYLIKEAK